MAARRACLLVCALATACTSGYRDPGDSEKVHAAVSDRNVATRVRIVLGEDPETAPYDAIRVSCSQGVVLLQGIVDRPRVKARAQDLARGCEGAKSVDNRITVRSSSD